MDRSIYINPVSDKFLSSDVRDILSELGVFVRSNITYPFIPNNIWYQCGYSDNELSDDSWITFVHPEERDRVSHSWDSFVKGEKLSFDEIYRFKTKNGKWIWLHNRCTSIERDENGSLLLYAGIDNDITHHKATENELRKAINLADRRVVESEMVRSIVALVSGSLKVAETAELVLSHIKTLVNYQRAMILLVEDSLIRIVDCAGFENRDKLSKMVFDYPDPHNPVCMTVQNGQALALNFGDIKYADFFKKTENALTSWICVPLKSNEKIIGALVLEHEEKDFFSRRNIELISALSEHIAISIDNAILHENMYNLAMIDSLMKIGSRHNFNHKAKLVFSQALRYQRALTTLLIDVDLFKSVNDTYGHDTGDMVLRKIAESCSGVLRDSDIIARYGGEEIIVLLPETQCCMGANVAERIRRSVQSGTYEKVKKAVTVSIGLYSVVPDKTVTLESCIQKADEALYTAKENGRNRVEVHPESMITDSDIIS
ncbi:MAG: diguanylate cyclase [Spirochaetes bacterium]|nr:diguanylate cyclase [Spirochaetota bacterium]MBN2772119.1 diguanylate cyclase [Spirochaetota bacterium]